MKHAVDETRVVFGDTRRPIRTRVRRRAAADRAVVIGIAGVLGLILWVMLAGTGSAVTVFWQTPSVALVLGGSVLVTLISCPGGRVRALWKVVRTAWKPRVAPPEDAVLTLVALATIARREGLLALDPRVKKIPDAFMQRGLFMAIDSADPATLSRVVRTEIESMRARHAENRGMLETMARTAPAFGMIGTLIGLVIMVGAMESPAQIGPGMAVALLTTLYGLVLAHAFCWPLARKLARADREEVLRKNMILEGVLAIQAGDHPRLVEQKLRAYLPESSFGSSSVKPEPVAETPEGGSDVVSTRESARKRDTAKTPIESRDSLVEAA